MRIVWVAAAYVLAVAAALVAAPEQSARIALAWWAPALVDVAAAVACAVAARHTRGRARLVWALFAVGLGVWGVTDLLAARLDLSGAQVPAVGPLDAGWLSSYVLAGLATMLLYLRLRPERGGQGMIDGLIVTIGVVCVGWVVFIGELARSDGQVETLLATLYPALDLACAVTLGWLLLRHRRRAPSWLFWIVAAFAALAISHAVHLVSPLPGPALALLMAAAHAAGAWCFALAALDRLRAPQKAWAAGTHDRPPVWSEGLPFMIGMAVVGLAVLRPETELRGAGALVAGLMALRGLEALSVGRGLVAERDQLLVTDPLTRAYNRRFLAAEGERAFARAARAGEPLAMIALDLDRFKQVNDQLGHAVGDRLLKAVAAAIADHLRTSDVLCRLGGDEFLVLCPATPADGAMVVAERLRVRVAEAAAEVVGDAGVTGSFGVAAFPADGPDTEALMRAADAALYDAKAQGRNAVARFAPAPVPAG